jgi:predicted ribonuclease YlaK
MAKVVHLFPDTNVLVQCRPLKELDWSAWREFDEVHLVISRPVQAEIDDQKNKGGDRLARRARRASSLLRQIILNGQEHSVVRPTDPNVKIFIRPRMPHPRGKYVGSGNRTNSGARPC